MKKEIAQQAHSVFEQIKRTDDNGNEFWSSRDLAKVLEYSEYRHFKPVIEKAKEACINSGQRLTDHFEHMLGMIEIGKGGQREIDDVKLSRYACYLIVQNADPAKEVVALGQTYFAIQTRLQELQQLDAYKRLNTEDEKRVFLRLEMTRHNKKLATAARNAGVITPTDYAIFQNHGYMGLYGGLDAKDLHRKKALTKNQNILDHMGSTELAANLFRATQTEDKLHRENVKGKTEANKTHFEVGRKVRKTIKELGGTMPENLPVADSIKKLKIKAAPKKSIKKKK
jgi:DNA-damage-inducible protein D